MVKKLAFHPGGLGREAGMTGPELRFIRTEMGMTQAELAKVAQAASEPWKLSKLSVFFGGTCAFHIKAGH
jgi:hypothetical protein